MFLLQVLVCLLTSASFLQGFCVCPWTFADCSGAELWGVLVALQSSDAVHVGVGNLGVVGMSGAC